MKKGTLFSLLFLYGATCFSQTEEQKDFIEKYKDIAISEMYRVGVPASITIAQAILESAWGTSRLAKNANNYFGIKCKKEWPGGKVYENDDEKHECFRRYTNAEESFTDHSDFLKSRPFYTSLFDLEITDYKGWAYGLKKAGYATSPAYAAKLIGLIEKYQLTILDSAVEIKWPQNGHP